MKKSLFAGLLIFLMSFTLFAQNPTVTVSSSPTSPVSYGTLITFTPSIILGSGVTLDHVDWDFDNDGTVDTTVSNGYAVQHTYNEPGTFTCKATAYDSNNASGFGTIVMEVTNDAPTVTLAADTTTGNYIHEFEFTATGSDPEGSDLLYSYDFGDGTTIEDTSASFVTHTYASKGVYEVSCSVKDEFNLKSEDAIIQITVVDEDPVIVSLVSDPLSQQGNATDQWTFTVTATDPEGSAMTCDWNFGTGVTPVTGDPLVAGVNSQSIYFPAKGTRDVVCTVYDSAGNYVSDFIPIIVNNAAPTAQLSCNNTNPDTTDVVTFDPTSSTDPDSDALRYIMHFGDGTVLDTTVATGSIWEHTYTTQDTFDAYLVVSDGEFYDTTNVITINCTYPHIAPVASFTTSCASDSIHMGEDVTFTSTSIGDNLKVEWAWDGDTTNFVADTLGSPIVHQFSTAGSNTVILKVTDTVHTDTSGNPYVSYADTKLYVVDWLAPTAVPNTVSLWDPLDPNCPYTRGNVEFDLDSSVIEPSLDLSDYSAVYTWNTTFYTDTLEVSDASVHQIHDYGTGPLYSEYKVELTDPLGVTSTIIDTVWMGGLPPTCVQDLSWNYVNNGNIKYTVHSHNSTDPFWAVPRHVRADLNYSGTGTPNWGDWEDISTTQSYDVTYTQPGTYYIATEVRNHAFVTDWTYSTIVIECVGPPTLDGYTNATNSYIKTDDIAVGPYAPGNNGVHWIDIRDHFEISSCTGFDKLEVYNATNSTWGNIWDDPNKGVYATIEKYPYHIVFIMDSAFAANAHNIPTFDMLARVVDTAGASTEFHVFLDVENTYTSSAYSTEHPEADTTIHEYAHKATRTFLASGEPEYTASTDLSLITPIDVGITGQNSGKIIWNQIDTYDGTMYYGPCLKHGIYQYNTGSIYTNDLFQRTSNSILGSFMTKTSVKDDTVKSGQRFSMSTYDCPSPLIDQWAHFAYGGKIVSHLIGYDDYGLEYKAKITHYLEHDGDGLDMSPTKVGKLGVTAANWDTVSGYAGYKVDLSLFSSVLADYGDTTTPEGEPRFWLEDRGNAEDYMDYASGWAKIIDERTMVMDLWEYDSTAGQVTITFILPDSDRTFDVTFDGPANGYTLPSSYPSIDRDVYVDYSFGEFWINPYNLYTYEEGQVTGVFYAQPVSYNLYNTSPGDLELSWNNGGISVKLEDPFTTNYYTSNNEYPVYSIMTAVYPTSSGYDTSHCSFTLHKADYPDILKSAAIVNEEESAPVSMLSNIATAKYMGITNTTGYYLIDKSTEAFFKGTSDEYGTWSDYGDKLKFVPYKGSDFRGVATLDFDGIVYRIVVLPFTSY